MYTFICFKKFEDLHLANPAISEYNELRVIIKLNLYLLKGHRCNELN